MLPSAPVVNSSDTVSSESSVAASYGASANLNELSGGLASQITDDSKPINTLNEVLLNECVVCMEEQVCTYFRFLLIPYFQVFSRITFDDAYF